MFVVLPLVEHAGKATDGEGASGEAEKVYSVAESVGVHEVAVGIFDVSCESEAECLSKEVLDDSGRGREYLES